MDAKEQTAINQQVAAQCNVIVHLASAIAAVHAAKAEIFNENGRAATDLAGVMGPATAVLMAQLADVLNGMDAVDEDEDAWTYPVFEAAHAMFPADAEA